MRGAYGGGGMQRGHGSEAANVMFAVHTVQLGLNKIKQIEEPQWAVHPKNDIMIWYLGLPE
jgi:hypothetical protein